MNSQPPLANRSGEPAGSGTVASHISPSAVASAGWRNANEMSLPHVTVSGGGSAGGGSGSGAFVQGALVFGRVAEVRRPLAVADDRLVTLRRRLAELGLRPRGARRDDAESEWPAPRRARPCRPAGSLSASGPVGVESAVSGSSSSEPISRALKIRFAFENGGRPAAGAASGSPLGRHRNRTTSEPPSHDCGNASSVSRASRIAIVTCSYNTAPAACSASGFTPTASATAASGRSCSNSVSKSTSSSKKYATCTVATTRMRARMVTV